MLRTLHVAALPFPSPQGTQALIAAFITAERSHGIDAQLAAYPYGCAGRVEHPLHGLPPRPRRVLADVPRSGPSAAKLVADVGLAHALPGLVARLEPARVVAHHVEAAAACALVGLRVPWWFVAHTSLAHELPSYFGPRWGAPLGLAGELIDRALMALAPRTWAVSPRLAELLSAASGRTVHALPLPWKQAAPTSAGEREAARAALGFASHEHVVLYAGNLDAYQGLCGLVAALDVARAWRPSLRFLVATESGERDLRALLAPTPALRPLTRSTGLRDELLRRRAHAAADVVVVPRSVPGGVPVKLLDAVARAVPVLASETACAGLALPAGCRVLPDGDTWAWARALADPPPPAPASLGGLCDDAAYVAAITHAAHTQPRGR